MFQLDQPDLDFGLYRIMHAKRGQVEAFLESEFDQLIDRVFANRGARQEEEAKKEYEAAKQQAIAFGAPDPDAAPMVQQARARYDVIRLTGGEDAEIYDHLYRFFSRYYDQGDFMSLRRYGKGAAGSAETYSIPYDGAEVVLHWANKDQYYIKTTENFSHFSFNPRQALEKDERGVTRQLFDDADTGTPLQVHFRIVDAVEGAHNNVKAGDKDERYFLLDEENPVAWEGSELVIRLHYRPDPDKPSRAQKGKWQSDRNDQTLKNALDALAGIVGDGKALADEYRAVLTREVPKGKDKKQPLLARYLTRYTASNTMDYFIHKDLGGFLRRELDFYLKNEVLKLDDFVGSEDADVQADIPEARLKAMHSALEKAQAIRLLSQRLIGFLAQLENFQKKLWLKKKFVVETNYCITLDRIPEKFYSEIAANDRQREDWVELFAIDEIESPAAYSVPLTVDFLKTNRFLLVDTRFFDANFIKKLLDTVEGLDDNTEGALVHSDNFQALQTLRTRYRKGVKVTSNK
jgi:adenine-specific DNA-methyltransferase